MPVERQVSMFYIELMKPRGERMLMHLIAIYFISLTILFQLEFIYVVYALLLLFFFAHEFPNTNQSHLFTANPQPNRKPTILKKKEPPLSKY